VRVILIYQDGPTDYHTLIRFLQGVGYMDILVFLVFLLLYFICAALTLIIHYYYRILVPGKGQYERDELVNIRGILKQELDGLFASQDKTAEYFALTMGSFLGFIFSYIGGIYGENYESYFFHSAILPVILYYGLGYIKKEGLEKDLPPIAQTLLKYHFSIFIGFTLSTLAKTIMTYGIYHVISFLWVFPNIVLLIALLVVRIVEKYKKDDYKLFFKRKTSDN